MLAEVRVALGDDLQQDGGALAARRGASPVLLGVHAPVGGAEGLGRIAVAAVDHRAAEGGADVEAVAALAEGRAAHGRDLVVAAGGEDAELVAAHPVGAAVALDGLGQ
jgi:hypothetical protein